MKSRAGHCGRSIESVSGKYPTAFFSHAKHLHMEALLRKSSDLEAVMNSSSGAVACEHDEQKTVP
jgi:hypothetical protein